MKKLVVVMVTVFAVCAANANVIFNDTFEGGTNTGWYTQINAPVVSTSGNGGSGSASFLYATSAGGYQQFLKYFNGQQVNVGDTITLNWEAKVSAFAAGFSPNILRFGLYNSGGSQISSNVAYSDPALANYKGYSIFATTTRANSSAGDEAYLQVMDRVNANNTLISTSAYALLDTIDDQGNCVEIMGTNAWTATQTLSMTRTADGWEITTVLGGIASNTSYSSITQSYSVVDANPTTSFDAVGIWYSTIGVTTNNFGIDNIELSYTAVPEPMTMVLLASGLLFLRRRK